MARLIELKIDVKKLNKKKFYEGKNGTYATLIVSVNDDVDDYDQDCSVYEQQDEKERKSKAKKNYVGNGKTFWSDEPGATAKEKAAEKEAEDNDDDVPDLGDDDDDDLPF